MMMRASEFTLFAAMLLPFALAASANANGAKPSAAGPTSDDFLALEKKATEAYFHGDGKFFQELLTDNTVRTVGGRRISKAEIVKRISGTKCNIQQGWSLTDPVLEKIDDDTYVFTYTTALDGDCTFAHQTQKEASPVRSATVWVKRGEKWRAAFHGEIPIVDPKTLSETLKQEEPKKASAQQNVAAGPGTGALMAAENSIWDVWKNKDARKIEELTTANITFVDIFGNYFKNKPDAVKDWTGSICEVKSFSLTNGVATFLSPTVGILTLTGSVDGECGGQKPPPVYGTSVYVKEGDMWKWAFGFNSPN
jgi:hypothetical protein